MSGVAWTFLARGIGQVTQYIISVSIARLLIPADFGLIAMVAVFTGLAGLFVDFGISAAIVQRSDLSPQQSGAAFLVTSALGALLCGLTCLLAPLIAEFYGRPELVAIARAMSPVFLFNAMGIVPRALLQRQFRLRRLAFNDLAANVVGAVVNLVLASSGMHVWSLIAGSLSTSVLGAGLALSATWDLRPALQLGVLKPLMGVSLNLLGFNFVNYWARNADNMIIGRMLGEQQLGVYTRAYSLMLLAMSQVTATISSAMIPALSAVQNDRQRTRSLYLRAVGLTAFVAFPLMIGMSATADTFMRVVYGAKWVEAIPILQILGIIGAVQAVLNPVGWIFVSQGRTDRMFRIGTVTAAVIVIGFAIGARFHSARAVAISYLVTNVIICIPEMKWAGDCIDMPLREMWRAMEKSAASALVMGVVVWMLGRAASGVPRPLLLVLEVAAGCVTFLAVAHLVRNPALIEARDLAADRWRHIKKRLRGAS